MADLKGTCWISLARSLAVTGVFFTSVSWAFIEGTGIYRATADAEQGRRAVKVSVFNAPSAFYSMLVQRAVSERWQIETRDGNRVQIVLEIGREGEIRGLAVEKSSGDPLYDEAALRAITEATPFPPFPDDFKEFLRVHLEFTSSGNTPVK